MKSRIFTFLVSIVVFILSIALVSCGTGKNNGDDTEIPDHIDHVESDTITTEDTEPEYPESNQAQIDREKEERTNEYLDYFKSINDDKIMHVTFGEGTIK